MKKVFIFTLALVFILIISSSAEAKKYPLTYDGKRVFEQCTRVETPGGGRYRCCIMYLWDGEKAVKICDLGLHGGYNPAMEKDHLTWSWGYHSCSDYPKQVYLPL